ncbi:hypothetical protein WKS98_07935 [Lagierella sp. ICN-221743]
MKKEAEIKKIIKYPIDKVYEIFTNREDYSWRNEISDFKKTGEDSFEETNHNDLTTRYKIIEKRPLEYFKIEMENKIIDGFFDISFKKVDDNSTEVILHQINIYKNFISYALNSIFLSLDKVLNLYIYEVERELKSRNITEM